MIDVVCGIITDNAGKVLLCQRSFLKSQGGLWEFPGGKIEEGEDAEAALTREIEEELLCTVLPKSALTSVVHHYGDTSIRLIPWLCSVEKGIPIATEHEALAWVETHELLGYDLAPADVPIAKEFIQLGAFPA